MTIYKMLTAQDLIRSDTNRYGFFRSLSYDNKTPVSSHNHWLFISIPNIKTKMKKAFSAALCCTSRLSHKACAFLAWIFYVRFVSQISSNTTLSQNPFTNPSSDLHIYSDPRIICMAWKLLVGWLKKQHEPETRPYCLWYTSCNNKLCTRFEARVGRNALNCTSSITTLPPDFRVGVWVLFLFAFNDYYRLSTTAIWIIEQHHHYFRDFLCLLDPPLTTSHPFTNSYLSSFASASSFLSSFV